MFEKFTQKSIDVIQGALNCASSFKHNKVLSTHIFLGLVMQTKGVQARILGFDKIALMEIYQNYADKCYQKILNIIL